jgi:hypothetical protein
MMLFRLMPKSMAVKKRLFFYLGTLSSPLIVINLQLVS